MSALLSVACSQVEYSATAQSLVKRTPTESGVPECDREASIMSRPWPTSRCCVMGEKDSE
jgi:hypothetical protein